MRSPPRQRRNNAPPAKPKTVEATPTPIRRPRFQFPLYILMIMTMVMGIALAPASYFMRADPDDHITRSSALIFMIAAPMLLVIVIHTAFRAYRWMQKR